MTVGIPMELLREHFSFRGRAGRLVWVLSGVAPWIGLSLFAFATLDLAQKVPDHNVIILQTGGFLIVVWGTMLIALDWCVSVRRLHDFNVSGKHLWLYVIPVIGWFFSLELYFKPGTKGPNKYGLPPGGLPKVVEDHRQWLIR